MLCNKNNDYEEISKQVDLIIMLMGLEKVANITMSTSDVSGRGALSGGQKRLLSVALALIKHPSVIILDEPTSGLDSKSSFEIVQNLKVLSDQGYTIIAIVHQPRQEAFDLFTHCAVVSLGTTVFNGKRENCIQYFEHCNRKAELATGKIYNSCDYIVDSIAKLETVLPSYNAQGTDLDHEYRENIEPLKVIPRLSTAAQIAVINARYWNTRPLHRKMAMLMIAFLTSLGLGLLQYRPGNDTISIALAIKGIIIVCLGLGALKNINLSFDYVV